MTFDPAAAVTYGRFVSVAYAMHAAAPINPTPPPLPLPSGYRFIAWVQMKDFILTSGDWSFYGLVAQSTTDANRFVLAIRGTIGLEEWWDDLTSLVPAPWAGVGLVGYGFNRIYQTLRIVDVAPDAAPEARAATAEAVAPAATFAEQVAATMQRHAAAPPSAAGLAEAVAPASKHIDVAAHSLGAALATLYVAENAARGTSVAGAKVNTPLLCTFASPRVGDATFANYFNGLGVTSWRVVNELDVVPYLPPIGFQHVQAPEYYNSGRQVRWSLGCWHSLATYLHLLDPKMPLDNDCAVTAGVALTAQASLRAQPLRAAAAVPAPAVAGPAFEKTLTVPPSGGHGATVTIKITLGDGD